ncbi:ABC transporter, periplasmic binding protein, thiB subfamily [metagenome]|uniref:ABC transporter, periplasmic binding protein, thiB subfamily n=1 Tax=metagenome TaxID=256318 RepID=A0A2P2CET2_9ZZZZ
MKVMPAWAALVLLTTTSLAACSAIGEGDDAAAPATDGTITDVVLVAHDSFSLPKKLIKQWEADTGYHLVVRASGDAGELTTKLVLTKNSPTGDLAFGVDNSFAGRALDEDVFAPYDVELPAGASAFELEADTGHTLAPIDTGAVCVNVDTTWFADHDLASPTTLDDLTDPTYRDLFVTSGAPTSSPGFAFLLATIAAKGDGWQDYWTDLMANGAKLTKGWEDAYYVDFTAGGGDSASRPIVLSYDSSPAYTVDKKTGTTSTAALLDTCSRQVEYAGVLDGAENVPGAESLLEFLLGPEVQAALPTSMYVYPVRDDAQLPAEWSKFAQEPTTTLDVPAEEIEANRDTWLTEWSDITSR